LKYSFCFTSTLKHISCLISISAFLSLFYSDKTKALFEFAYFFGTLTTSKLSSPVKNGDFQLQKYFTRPGRITTGGLGHHLQKGWAFYEILRKHRWVIF